MTLTNKQEKVNEQNKTCLLEILSTKNSNQTKHRCATSIYVTYTYYFFTQKRSNTSTLLIYLC